MHGIVHPLPFIEVIFKSTHAYYLFLKPVGVLIISAGGKNKLKGGAFHKLSELVHFPDILVSKVFYGNPRQ